MRMKKRKSQKEWGKDMYKGKEKKKLEYVEQILGDVSLEYKAIEKTTKPLVLRLLNTKIYIT